VRVAAELPGVERLRLSSIEINHVTPDLVAALRESKTVSAHLHVPLQSGDDRVLRAMGRRYTAGQFLRRLEPLADFNLTSDVIVGFPQEDEAAFANTLGMVERAGMTKVHVFPYSPRPGTATAAEDTVPSAIKKERSARLRALSDDLCRRRWRSKLGTVDRVLVDRPGRGYGDDYTPWLVDAEIGELVEARAVGLAEEGILAVAA
jgi:tRNA A37 methylthiotransferase MiaB